MSAIFGLIRLDDQPAERADLARMDRALARHGDDGGGMWLAGSTGLGVRLRHFTPQDAHEQQPLVVGELTLVADGRIDDRASLLAALGLPHTAELPDSALILRAYRRWGSACLNRLVGVYAFAIVDTATQTLFAARSPIIAPSLCYTMAATHLALATMPSALLALPTARRAINEPVLAHMLTGQPAPMNQTLYRDIERLPTGSWLRVSREGLRIERFWRPDPARVIDLPDDEAYLAAFNALFEQVVADQLRSLTPVAIQLSGGLDSASVAAVATSHLAAQGAQLAAFTEVPRTDFSATPSPHTYVDETPLVQALAALHPALDLQLMHTDGQFFLHGLATLFEHLEQPFQNTANRVWIEAILAATRKRGAHVLLDGLQGNITASWPGGALATELLRNRRWDRLGRELAAVGRAAGPPAALRTLGGGLVGLLPAPAWLAVQRLRPASQQQAGPAPTPINPVFAAAQGVSVRQRQPRIRNQRQLRYYALATQDVGAYLSAYRAMYGVDMRSPLADVRLAEFCITLPEAQHRRDGQARSLLRRALAGRLPPAVLQNSRRGIQAADWFERLVAAKPQVEAALITLEQSELARRSLDLPRLRQLAAAISTASLTSSADQRTYMWALQYGLMVGAFLHWFEAGLP